MAITILSKAEHDATRAVHQPVKLIKRRLIEDGEGTLYVEETHRYPVVKLTTKTVRRA